MILMPKLWDVALEDFGFLKWLNCYKVLDRMSHSFLRKLHVLLGQSVTDSLTDGIV